MLILNVRFRSDAEFEESYQADMQNGGLFCPTTTEIPPDSELVIELSVPALPNKVLIRGRVKSWRPALPRLRIRAGAIVEFLEEEAQKRDFVVETLRGDRKSPTKRKHGRLPVVVPVRYRTNSSADMIDCELREISAGGAMLATLVALPLETEVILEITPPGSVSPLSISGKATYHTESGATGLKFVYRDAGGSRRLRELVRRLRDE